MNTIKITKMQGCGNDFVIIDYSEFEKTNMEMSDLAKKICDRRRSKDDSFEFSKFRQPVDS